MMQSGPSGNRGIEKIIKLLKAAQVLHFKMKRYVKYHYAILGVVQNRI